MSEANDWPADLLPASDYAISVGPVWVQATHRVTAPTLPPQGWKLHVSARPSTCRETLDVALEVLRPQRATFKVAGSEAILKALNDGAYGPASIGKFITVYPDQDSLVELAQALADALRGRSGPRVVSDRRIRPDAPVYYRYGPFAPQLARTRSGGLEVSLVSPEGSVRSGAAREHFDTVPWAPDPFRPAVQPAADAPLVLGEHYAISGVISRSPRGGAYRAIDLRDGRRVVVKHARAFVNETTTGDARTYLRAERRILARLAGIEDTPSVIDHFQAGEDEYLVLTDVGGVDLRFDVLEHGLYSPEPSGPRTLRSLGRALMRTIDAIHATGVVIRDVAPKNVLVIGDDRYGLVDFELSAFEGRHQFGWSPGYSTDRQRIDGAPDPTDDLYSLGATLFYAVAGIDPFLHQADGSSNLEATFTCLREVVGAFSDAEVIIGLLMSDEAQDRHRGAALLRAAAVASPGPRGRPPAPRPTKQDSSEHSVDEILDHLRVRAAGAARMILSSSEHSHVMDLSVQSGAAGLVAELSQHDHGAQIAAQLGRAICERDHALALPPGLMFGRAGLSAAVHLAARATNDEALAAQALRLFPTAEDASGVEDLDVARGQSGLLLGALVIDAPGLAATIAQRLATDAARWPQQAAELPASRPGHAIRISEGYAHGSAGVTYARMVAAVVAGDEIPDDICIELERLSDVGLDLAREAQRATARPMAASWCQGLAGIGAVLLRASEQLREEELLATARACANAAHSVALRSPSPSQCCGVAGVGELDVDLFVATGDEEHLRRARRLLDAAMQRGDLMAPFHPSESGGTHVQAWGAFGWGDGLAGILALSRRVADPTTPRHWMGPATADSATAA